ncbi:lipase LipB [Legionella wadsworthii]|uniref:Lipase LipB n=1 Tax=Legionella wadsworthii TaxID=28088 RepID=A0A378LT61_9GAMM|nr:alpha/beta fold hydrolase [Legionella wadsworthii]STY29897.1 lipase LipB [Legionella wadsworthii]
MIQILLSIFQRIPLLLFLFCGMSALVYADAFSHKRNHTSVSHVTQTKTHAHREIIVLVHGLMRTSLSMLPLKNYLQRQGYEVYSYNYPSAKYGIKEHGISLNYYIVHLMEKNPGVKINFITHSLGGIITREALAHFSSKQLKNIGSLIMLAPPNQGSTMAKWSTEKFPLFTSTIKPLVELSSAQTSYVHFVPVPKIKIGIIAGRYDAKVPPEYTRLEGQEAPMIVDSTHTFIMNNKLTKQLIMSFLKEGTFSSKRKP